MLGHIRVQVVRYEGGLRSRKASEEEVIAELLDEHDVLYVTGWDRVDKPMSLAEQKWTICDPPAASPRQDPRGQNRR